MKIDLTTYGYENFKPNFDNVTAEDLLTKSPFAVPNSLTGYILPKEFAARLSSKLGSDEIVFPYRDVPLTNRNILESHIFTKCALLEAPTEKYNYLLPIFNSIQVWGEASEQPTSFSKFSKYILKEYLDLFKDRIRFIPPQLYEDDPIDPLVLLKACGVSHKDLFKNIIDFINTTVDFKYQRNIVNFLKTYIDVELSTQGIVFISKIEGLRGISGFGAHTTDPYKIARFLYAVYFTQYTQWANDSSWVIVDGDRIYVDHHSVYEIGKFDEYLKSNAHYRNQLPFGIHPSKYFKERIEKLAAETHSEAMAISYPDDFKGYVDLSNSPHRQLLCGLDLVNEGVYMKHCVGGQNYQEQMADGETIFFHLHVPGDKYGATLSMCSAGQYSGAYRLNGEWWSVDQYYGFDDRYAREGESGKVLQEFLKTHFTPYSSKIIKKIKPAPERQLHDYVYQADWKLKLYEKIYSKAAMATWKNLTGGPSDYSLEAELARVQEAANGRAYSNIWGGDDDVVCAGIAQDGIRERINLANAASQPPSEWNFGSMQYTPELITQTQTARDQDWGESFYPTVQPRDRLVALHQMNHVRRDPTYTQVQPRTPHIDFPPLWQEHRGEDRYDPYGGGGFFGGMKVLEPDQVSFEISVTRYPTTKYGYHENTLRPIKLIDEIERTITLIVNGITIANGTNAHPVVLPPGATLQVVTRNATTRVNLAVTVDTYASKPEIRREVLSQNATYTNTTRHPQAVVAYLVTEIAPAKIPLLINNLFYPPKRGSVQYDRYIRGRPTRRGSIIYPNYQTMGRIYR